MSLFWHGAPAILQTWHHETTGHWSLRTEILQEFSKNIPFSLQKMFVFFALDIRLYTTYIYYDYIYFVVLELASSRENVLIIDSWSSSWHQPGLWVRNMHLASWSLVAVGASMYATEGAKISLLSWFGGGCHGCLVVWVWRSYWEKKASTLNHTYKNGWISLTSSYSAVLKVSCSAWSFLDPRTCADPRVEKMGVRCLLYLRYNLQRILRSSCNQHCERSLKDTRSVSFRLWMESFQGDYASALSVQRCFQALWCRIFNYVPATFPVAQVTRASSSDGMHWCAIWHYFLAYRATTFEISPCDAMDLIWFDNTLLLQISTNWKSERRKCNFQDRPRSTQSVRTWHWQIVIIVLSELISSLVNAWYYDHWSFWIYILFAWWGVENNAMCSVQTKEWRRGDVKSYRFNKHDNNAIKMHCHTIN